MLFLFLSGSSSTSNSLSFKLSSRVPSRIVYQTSARSTPSFQPLIFLLYYEESTSHLFCFLLLFAFFPLIILLMIYSIYNHLWSIHEFNELETNFDVRFKFSNQLRVLRFHFCLLLFKLPMKISSFRPNQNSLMFSLFQ